MLRSKTSRLLSLLVAFVMAFGLGLSGARNLWASASSLQDEGLTFNAENGYTDSYEVPQGKQEGQYMLTLKMTEPVFTEEESYKYSEIAFEASWGEGESAHSDYFSYNSYLGLYYLIATVKTGDILSIHAYFDMASPDFENLTVIRAEVNVESLQIGEFNNYSIYGLNIPASVELNNVAAGDYTVTLSEVYDAPIPEGTTFTVTIGGVTYDLPYVDGMLGYSALISLPRTGTLEFGATTESGEIVTVDLVVRHAISSTEFTGEVTLAEGETGVYSFTVAADGYYTVNQGASTLADGSSVEAYYSLEVKDDPNYLVSTNVSSHYPISLRAGATYYLSIYCDYVAWGEETPSAVTTEFTVDAWDHEELVLNEVLYAPVSLTDSGTRYLISADIGAGEYSVSLVGVPTSVSAVTVHFGDQTVELHSTDFYYVDRVTLAATTEIWMTSSEECVVGLYVGKYEEPASVKVGENDLTLVNGESIYYLDSSFEVGTYRITFNNKLANGTLESTTLPNVTVYDSYLTVVANAGESFGLFTVEAEDLTGGFYLLFSNVGAEVNVTVVIELETHLIALNEPTTITFTSDVEELVYYVQHLYAGRYSLQVELPTGMWLDVVYPNGNFTFFESGEIEFTLTLVDEEGVELPYTNIALQFGNPLGENFSFTVTLTVIPEVTE